MPWAQGVKAQVIFDQETTYKTDPGTIDAKVIPFTKDGLKASKNLIDIETIRGNRNKSTPVGGNIDVAGGIDFELSDTAFSTLLKHLLGSNTTTGASDPYTHTIKVGNLPVGLVIEKGFTDIAQYFKYNGCRINKGVFKFPKEGTITGSFDIIGAKETVGASSMDSTPTSYSHIPFTAFQATIQEGGGTIATVTEAEITIDNSLDKDGYTIGSSGERTQLPEGFAVVSGSITALFDSITLYNKAVNSTESSLKITLDRGVTPARSIEFYIPELIYERQTPAIEGPKGVLVTLPFKAYYDNSTEASSLQIIIKNGLATI